LANPVVSAPHANEKLFRCRIVTLMGLTPDVHLCIYFRNLGDSASMPKASPLYCRFDDATQQTIKTARWIPRRSPISPFMTTYFSCDILQWESWQFHFGANHLLASSTWSRPPPEMSTRIAQDVSPGPAKNLNILSLGQYAFTGSIEESLTRMVDAGGPRGISQLMILKNVMESLHCGSGVDSEDNVKRPCEVFQAIGGVGTGG
jgi:hypothetical protein